MKKLNAKELTTKYKIQNKMKKLLTIITFFSISFSTRAQNAKVDSKGNYTAVTHSKDTTPAKTTGKTYTDAKGKVYLVYISKKGKLFVKKISKNGNEYKMYLKLEK